MNISYFLYTPWLQTEPRELRFAAEAADVSSSKRPERHWCPQRGVYSLEVKRPGREIDHSPSASAEIKTNTSISPYAVML
jgi:hypothetical protein